MQKLPWLFIFFSPVGFEREIRNTSYATSEQKYLLSCVKGEC